MLRSWFCAASFVSLLYAPQVSAYDVAPVSGGGTLKGRVTFNGTVPTRTVIPTKDENICGGPRKDPLVILGADKGVQEVVLSLTGIEKGKAWPAAAKPAVIDQKACRFVPNVQIARVGKLGVVNSDPLLHNTHGYSGKRTTFNLALPNLGQSVEVDVARAGPMRVECDVHGWMLGWVHVVDNPYHAMTDDNGGFEISDIPPGKYSLVVNQEYTGTTTMDVEITSGKTTDLMIELKK
jgi:Carboxypeptidase regulatory-like domain